ncbi:flavin reductase family protein [Streptomyces sp. MUM 178J]|uniref:flavin reductase family protein n=1 Tax=Streptomyces sp. MUM 178J TaxID=2791991 RepID=UPI001F03A4DB|nr:flavin reductase family protein [Streptomyces sp. MUM 178J]WRQ83546.1 flavin reductase family protein [Streptomyces sp. MUM 178J]
MAAAAVRYLRSAGGTTAGAAGAANVTEAAGAAGAAGTSGATGTSGPAGATGAAGRRPAYDALPRPDLRAVRDDERAPLDPAEFRRVLGHFATGVTVVAALDADGPAGFACQSFASLSLDPPLVAFMVGRTSATWPRIARAGSFCVNVLGAHQAALCRGFAVSGADKFAGVEWDAAPATGSPRLAGVPAWIDCTVQAVHTGGDHLIVVGRVRALDAARGRGGEGGCEGESEGAGGEGAGGEGEGSPLLFHRGRFGRFSG